MLVYWLLFAYFALGALLRRGGVDRGAGLFFFSLGGLFLLAAIGLRYQVGGDWGAYERMFTMAAVRDLGQMLPLGDPAYQLLNWTVRSMEWPLWVVNLICAAIFTYGLVRFAKVQDSPWLALLIAVPYLVIVVSMGYTRQAVAIGIIMMGLAAVQRGASIARFALYVAGAALFHKSAVVAMLLVALAGRRNKLINILVVLCSAVLLYDSLLQDSITKLMENYVQAKYSSQGAAIRIFMSIVPAALFFLRRSRFRFSEQSDLLWRNFSIAAFLLAAALVIVPSSTAVDRIALYILPLQIAVLSQVPRVFAAGTFSRLLVVLYAFAIEFVWLNFADNAGYWVPYSSYLWM
ncbi:MAG: EpsG family protein [Sphingomicrobium sp.]|nr:EpsG family protein [Sphingomonadales bacterium]